MHDLLWIWRGHRHLPLGGVACRRIRTRGFLSSIDKQVGEEGKKVIYYVWDVSVFPNCSSISVSELFPNCTCGYPMCSGMKHGMASPNPALMGRSMIPIMFQFIPGFSGHLSLITRDTYPSAFIQILNTIALIKNKTPLHVEKGKLNLRTCGEGGIRTYIPPAGTGRDLFRHPAERVGFEPTVGTSPTTVFETVPFNHSGTSPIRATHYTKMC